MNGFRSEYRRAAQAVRRAVGLGPPVTSSRRSRIVSSPLKRLARLTPRQRAALVLTEALGYSGEETGAVLGIKASTVWALTHQARTALRGTTEENPDG